jgi:hypothetical protein
MNVHLRRSPVKDRLTRKVQILVGAKMSGGSDTFYGGWTVG